VVRARDDAAKTDQGEDAALARFRSALEPEWSHRDDIAARCQGTPRDKGALDAIERLRYAEEHAVRREAGELAPLRRRVQAIVDRDLTGRAPEGASSMLSTAPAPVERADKADKADKIDKNDKTSARENSLR
jgi:hypothetical protein